MMKRTVMLAALAAFLAAGLSGPAGAADFYKGKRIKIIVPTASRGTYDIFGRLLAKHMMQYIPGNPKVIVQNMPGAGGLIGANFVANVAPKDGTVFAIAHSSTPTASKLVPTKAKFKSEKLGWIGNITRDPFIAFCWHKSKVKSLQDLYTIGANVGGNAVGSASIDMAILTKALFGFKLNIITGYRGPGTYFLAMERGELDCTMGTGYSNLRATKPEWFKTKKANIILQMALTPHPNMPRVPLIYDIAQTDEYRNILKLVLARTVYRMPVYAPTGIPKDRLEILRRAFDKTMKDKKFLAAADKARVPVEGVLNGEALTAAVVKITQTPKAIVDKVGKLYGTFIPGGSRKKKK
jgi:tripartite-type tricarboxylate transporter receptor subunit TctC